MTLTVMTSAKIVLMMFPYQLQFIFLNYPHTVNKNCFLSDL